MPSSQDLLIDPNACRGTTIVSVNNNITSDTKKSKVDKTSAPSSSGTNVSINNNFTSDLNKSDANSPNMPRAGQVNFRRSQRLNRIQGKSVSLKSSRALLLSSSCILRRNWYHVSYDTENYVSYDFKVDVWRRIAMKHNNIQVGTGSNLPAAQEKTCTLQLMSASNRMPTMRRVSNRWTQAENPGENHWTIGRYDFNLVRQISYFYEILARTYDRSYDRS